MKCTKIFAANYTSRTTSEITRRAVALFENGEELIFAKSLDEVKAALDSGKNKEDVTVVTGQYGRYAAFSVFTEKEELA